MHKLSETVERKFVASFDVDEWEIETDTGWEDISAIHKTIVYDEWKIETSSGKKLMCADNHILFDENLNEIFTKNCKPKVTHIMTKDGPELVFKCNKTEKSSNMYDITVDSDNHRFYTNDILSHNTTTAACVILHYILFNEVKLVALLAQKGDAAREILDRVKLSYESLPDWLQQGVVSWNKGSIELENGCKVIAAATSSSAIRGKSVNLLYIDECVEGNSFVCVEIKDRYFYSKIADFININESDFINKIVNNMSAAIYKTINKINGKEYVGLHRISGDDILYEMSESGSIFSDGYLGSGIRIKDAIVKYGPENMRQELIFFSDDINKVSNYEEMIVTKEYAKNDNTYNLKVGGLNYILTETQRLSKGDKIKHWIRNNPEKHKERMDKINKNPDKIAKTAAKHSGMKRSPETIKNISESLKGSIPYNLGKKYMHNSVTGEIQEFASELPAGWKLGTGCSNGPKNKKAYFNSETLQIKFYVEDSEPFGWSLGRK